MMKTAIPCQTYKIAPPEAGLTVEAYLKAILRLSGRQIQELARSGCLRRNEQPAGLRQKLADGDLLQIARPPKRERGPTPQAGRIDLLYEDGDLLVLNKPPGQLVHPAGRTTRGTLANLLAGYWRSQGIDAAIRPVHRLDRDTSGCVLFAKSAGAQSRLEQQLRAGVLKREYLALTAGRVAPSAGVIDAPLGKCPAAPNRRAVAADGDPAVTHYRAVAVYGRHTLLAITLETGRTHQIRVHLAHIGHPVLGDAMYGGRSAWLRRQALHAAAVRFHSLTDGAPRMARAPLPEDMRRAITLARTTL